METHDNTTLTEQEIVNVFVSVLSQVYLLKEQWVVQIPTITYITKQTRLKLLIVQSGTLLQTEMLRMDMALKMLDRAIVYGTALADEFRFEKFLFKNVTGLSLYDDMKLINHLMLIIGIEVNSFRLLDVLSKSMRPGSVNRLMRQNLNGAIAQERQFLAIYRSYFDSICQ